MDFQAFHYIITSTGRGNSYRRRGCERELRYYIADLHFFHKAVNTDMDHRGFASVEEMNETMIEKWNARVRKKDEVVIIGDLRACQAAQRKVVSDKGKSRPVCVEQGVGRKPLSVDQAL